jgi:hypothetical protein
LTAPQHHPETAMSLQLVDTAPDFTLDYPRGPISFHD